MRWYCGRAQPASTGRRLATTRAGGQMRRAGAERMGRAGRRVLHGYIATYGNCEEYASQVSLLQRIAIVCVTEP